MDDDEHWLCEEELYSEGSCDEEKSQCNSSRRRYKNIRSKVVENDGAAIQCDNMNINTKCTDETTNEEIEYNEEPGYDRKVLKASRRRQSLTNLVEESERTFESMKGRLQELKESVYDMKTFNELFDVEKFHGEMKAAIEDRKPLEVHRTSSELETAYKEMMKLDDVLRKKTEEEKEAKLRRIREEDEACQILLEYFNMDSQEMSDALRINSNQFLRLIGKSDNGSDDKQKESGGGEVDNKKKMIETATNDSTGSKAKFIERNIKLAKCGKGVLSLTDDEKDRLGKLLQDIDEELVEGEQNENHDPDIRRDNVDKKRDDFKIGTNWFSIDSKTKTALERIDEKLEVYENIKKSEYFPEVKLKEGTKREEVKEKDESEKGMGCRDNTSRLRELDRLLNNTRSPTDQEIEPLSEDDIHVLVEEATHWDTLFTKSEESLRSTPSQETISDLVEEAHSLMPNYKFKCIKT